MTTATKRGRARTSRLVLAEEIVQAELDLVEANARAKAANTASERASTIAGNAAMRVEALRRQLVARIRMYRELTKVDGLEERVAARWLHEERLRRGIEQAERRPTSPDSIDDALPYSRNLEEAARRSDEA